MIKRFLDTLYMLLVYATGGLIVLVWVRKVDEDLD